MKRSAIVPLFALLLVSASAAAQTPADDVKSALEAFQAAWNARDADALGACLHDPLIGYFQPGQVFDRPGMLELARTTPRQPIEVTHRPYQPEVYGDVAFALMPTHLKPAPEVGLGEFDGLTGAAVLLKTDGVWRMVAGCNIWDEAAQDAASEFQTRVEGATAGGAIDWTKFAPLFHPKAVVLGPTGEGGAVVARRLKPDGETLAEDVPEVSFAPVTDRRLVLATGWGVMVQAYDVQASFSSGAPMPCRLVEIRCYVPDEHTWQYLFAAIVPRAE
jgi:ketosteroid isomerase-like protein